MKPRLSCKEVRILATLHETGKLPRGKPGYAIATVQNKKLVCCTEAGWQLTLNGKQIARHLTGVT